MIMQNVIPLKRICEYFHIDLVIIRDFADFGLFPIVVSDDEDGMEIRNLDRLKKIISLHNALGINKEGIEVILDLRERVSMLQMEVERLCGEVEKIKRDAGIGEPEALKERGLFIEIDLE